MLRALLIATLLVVSTGASAQDVAAEDVIDYRQSVYKLIFWNFGQLSDMARDRKPFDRAEFQKRARRVANLSQQLLEGYAVGSHTGADTDARPEIWSQWDDFQVKLGDFQREARSLAKMSASAEPDALKAQFVAVGGTCKGCHDLYRKD